MRVLLNWLREFVPVEIPAVELAERLTLAGLEVEEVRDLNPGGQGIVLGRIEDVVPHPSADRLVLCRVTTGSQTRSIVCGARNMKPGDFVPVATPGSRLPSGKKIEKSKIRGQISEGMLCSEAELGISGDHEGIMILPPEAPLGELVFRYLGLEDTLLDVAVYANRGDCLSIMGLAREVSVLLGLPFYLSGSTEDWEASLDQPPVELQEPDLCPRYAGVRISGVKIEPAPLRVRMKLMALGFRSINNVVDATNYLMLETGQPLHAFDWKKIRQGRIVVRRANRDTRFATLDGVDRELEPSDLVIADGEGVIALAGIMGGANSEVTAETTELFLESAHFSPGSIRKTARRLGLKTEASYRFERGVDPEGVLYALKRAARLIAASKGSPLSGISDRARSGPERQILWTDERAKVLLGTPVARQTARDILTRLGGKVSDVKEGLRVVPPSFRMDWNDDADLIEEVARVQGYGAFPATLPLMRLKARKAPEMARWEQRARQVLLQRNLFEAITLTFASSQGNRLFPSFAWPGANPLSLVNPISNEDSEMRLSLVGGLLNVLARNLKRGEKWVRLFELGKVYGEVDSNEREEKRLSILLYGEEEELGLAGRQKPYDFFDLKGIVEDLLEAMDVSVTWDRFGEEGYLHGGKSAEIRHEGKRVGILGELHPEWARVLDVPPEIQLCELDFTGLVHYGSEVVGFQALSRYPSIVRDFAIVVKEDLSAGRILGFIKGLQEKFVEEVRVFDQYIGSSIPSGQKSLGYRVTYRSAERTLTEEEIEVIHRRIVEKTREAFGGEIRMGPGQFS